MPQPCSAMRRRDFAFGVSGVKCRYDDGPPTFTALCRPRRNDGVAEHAGCSPRPVCEGPPDAMKRGCTRSDLFWQRGVTLPQCPPNPPQMLTVAMARPGIVGTWRDIGSKRCVIKVAGSHDHHGIERGNRRQAGHRAHDLRRRLPLTRDGTTAVGVDYECGHDLRRDMPESESQSTRNAWRSSGRRWKTSHSR